METNERVPERQLLCFSARVWIMYEMLPLQQMEGEGGDERPWRGLSWARGGCGCRCAMVGEGSLGRAAVQSLFLLSLAVTTRTLSPCPLGRPCSRRGSQTPGVGLRTEKSALHPES